MQESDLKLLHEKVPKLLISFGFANDIGTNGKCLV